MEGINRTKPCQTSKIMKYSRTLLFLTISFSLAPIALNAVGFTGPDGGLWSDPTSWDSGSVPAISEDVIFAPTEDRTINVDGNFSIRSLTDGFSAGGVTLAGTGTLTIDANWTTTIKGLDNATGNDGNLMLFTGNIHINNTGGARTIVRNSNSDANIVRFAPGSNLVLTTGLQTSAPLGAIEFNGNISGENLFIGSTNAFFGDSHNSAELAAVVFFSNSLLRVNGGTVLHPAGKFQVNGSNTVLELNSSNTVNGAYISISGSNDFRVIFNANQENMGWISMTNGSLDLEIDPEVTNVSFSSSYFQDWGSGSVTITGFREGTIRFGTSGAGLTTEQLAAINGGVYSLTADGYLTEQAIDYWARFAIDSEGWVFLAPWIDRYANVLTAPYIWIEGVGYAYIDDAVAVSGFGWIYSYQLEGLDLSEVDGTPFAYSSRLNKWFYLPTDIGGNSESWLYMF